MAALEPLEANTNEDAAVREKMEEAVFWYEKFLGFKIVGGEEGKQ
jgi:kinetochore protein Spc25, animal type